jgi:hypothetical protein
MPMLSGHIYFSKPLVALSMIGFLSACGGSGSEATAATGTTPLARPVTGAVILRAPVLSFNDTGISVTDGVTQNGLWAVDSAGIDWEFSLDMGGTWSRGVGSTFEVKGDGAKMIWVRAYDEAGNTSEVVRVNCMLDTTPPASVGVQARTEGVTNTLQLSGIEPGARWEYALDPQGAWMPGRGASLGTLGNGLATVWLRQVDMAGNASAPEAFDLIKPDGLIHEVSGEPLQPSFLAQGLQTMLVHGVVVRGDADYVRWDIPKAQQLLSVKLVQYVSEDAIAFYALQRSQVFDAGIDVSRMLVYGHMGPSDLGRNVLANVPKSELGEGAMTLWFQQTGSLPTQYALEVVLTPAD